MTLPPDKLFQQRLENFSKNPPPQAWDRIEAGLNKKKSNRGWMMIAASVIVVIVAASMIYYKSQNTSEVAISNIEPSKPLTEKITTPSSEEQNVTTIDHQEPSPLHEPDVIDQKYVASTPSKRLKNNSFPEQIIVNNPEEDQTTQRTLDPLTDNATNEIAVEESNPVTDVETTLTLKVDVAVIEQKPTGRKIMYSASDVHARFLKEKQSITLSPNAKPETGLEKIFDFTYSLKNGESSLGHLRRLKNDFISNAFNNQKNEKQ